MSKVTKQIIPYGRQDITQEDINAVIDVLKSDFITQGPTVKNFEEAVANFVGAKHGISTNSAQIGVYHTAFKLSMFATIGLMAIKSIASPKFAELFKKEDLDSLKKVTQQSTKLIFWTTLPLVIIFISFSEYIMGLFGEEFTVGVFAFIILSIGRVIVSFSGAAGNLLQMCGRQVIFMNVAVIGSVINIILNFTLIPIYGINGSAIATMVSLVSFNLLLVYFVKKEFGFYTFYIPFQKRN